MIRKARKFIPRIIFSLKNEKEKKNYAWELLCTWIPIISWANSADMDSPLSTETVEEPSGLIISAKTEALNTGYKYINK